MKYNLALRKLNYTFSTEMFHNFKRKQEVFFPEFSNVGKQPKVRCCWCIHFGNSDEITFSPFVWYNVRYNRPRAKFLFKFLFSILSKSWKEFFPRMPCFSINYLDTRKLKNSDTRLSCKRRSSILFVSDSGFGYVKSCFFDIKRAEK